MQELYDKGWTLREIGLEIGLVRETVRKYVTQQKDRSHKRIKIDESWIPLPTCAEEVVLRDVPKDKARFRVQIEQNGKKMGEWFTDAYPNWRQMYERCLVYNVENAMDFSDQENCLKEGCRQVHSFVIGQGGVISGRFTIDFLTDEPVTIEELLL